MELLPRCCFSVLSSVVRKSSGGPEAQLPHTCLHRRRPATIQGYLRKKAQEPAKETELARDACDDESEDGEAVGWVQCGESAHTSASQSKGETSERLGDRPKEFGGMGRPPAVDPRQP
ncbi:hypothetical protein O181_042710 [Austropuccinia psidii MF-1]|uniref:Uncharacterized protein n=1 Tax=Austropuccinia psidii MF-1 TaxID=1389203 RepID=A0A9Q3DH48_9BASI|nr:hypothetical protein [Austropuccinia psidii MF-1]